MFKDMTIRNGCGSTSTFEEFKKDIMQLHQEGYEIAIGTDSQRGTTGKRNKTRCWNVVTCIVAHNTSGGGKIWWVKDRKRWKEFYNLGQRLLHEAMCSIMAAEEIEDFIGRECVSIHLDIGTDLIKNKSAKYEKELKNLVLAQGYNLSVKPDSWASDCADKYVKS